MRVLSKRWIDELNNLYWKIVRDASIPVENLDKANEIICEAIEKLRPLAHKTLCERCRTDEPHIRKNCTAHCKEHERERTPYVVNFVEEILGSPRGTFLIAEKRKPNTTEMSIIKATRKIFNVPEDYCLKLTKHLSLPDPKNHKKQWNKEKRRYNPPFKLVFYTISIYDVWITCDDLMALEKKGFAPTALTHLIRFRKIV